MKIFLRRVLYFLTPVLFFLSYPIYILSSKKENFYNLDEIINSDNKYIIGYKYNERNYKYLKYKKILLNKKFDVLALGSSRVLQFRDKMFEASFYNAGYTVSTIDDFEFFLKLIPEDKLPRYLIIGLDQWMFNKEWNTINRNDNKIKEGFTNNTSKSIFTGLEKLNLVYDDIIHKQLNFHKVYQNSNRELIGLNATLNFTGFRNDGSMFYGKQINNLQKKSTEAEDYLFKETFTRINNANRRFEYGNFADENALKTLEKLLHFCKNKNILVIGFLPPYANEVYEEMQKTNNYNYINDLDQKLHPIFMNFGFDFYSFNTLKDFDSNDNEAIDGFHGGERAYLRLLIKMLDNNSKLKNVCNKNKLLTELRDSNNDYLIYE